MADNLGEVTMRVCRAAVTEETSPRAHEGDISASVDQGDERLGRLSFIGPAQSEFQRRDRWKMIDAVWITTAHAKRSRRGLCT